MTSLYDYLKQTRRFLRDQAQKYLNEEDLVEYINRARREIALRSQSIRILTPVSGAITNIQITNPGSNYQDPMVIITPPDAPAGAQPYPGGAQAVAIAQQINGQVSDIAIEFGGDGYFQPQVTIVDSSLLSPFVLGSSTLGGSDVLGTLAGQPGADATAVAVTTPISVSNGLQEVYPFSAVPLQNFPGVGEIFAVKSVSFIYANYRYSLPCFSFSEYQAWIRQYPNQYYYVPAACAQFGQGTNGSIYFYPIPSTLYQMEWDCLCLPADLNDDQDFEAIPGPWTDAVPYFAAHLSYLELQNLNGAKFYLDLYDNMAHRYSAYARPGRRINPYGRR